MKKLVAIMMAVAMSVSCFVVTASAVDMQANGDRVASVTEVQPREILTYSMSQNIYEGTNSQLVAKVTLKYTVRGEGSNSSGGYITGVTSASIKKVKGWESVSSLTILRNKISYSRNHQIAYVPITYKGSIGSGNSTYSATITISLL